VAEDEYVSKLFADHCWSIGKEARYCVSDEHYIPTLLASLGEPLHQCGCSVQACFGACQPTWRANLHEVLPAHAMWATLTNQPRLPCTAADGPGFFLTCLSYHCLLMYVSSCRPGQRDGLHRRVHQCHLASERWAAPQVCASCWRHALQ